MAATVTTNKILAGGRIQASTTPFLPGGYAIRCISDAPARAVDPPYQPYNPTRHNIPTLQNSSNYANANDFRPSPQLAQDRIANDPHATPKLELRDGYTRLPDLRYPNNDYNPRKYPTPNSVQTYFPPRVLPPVHPNGTVNAYNALAPRPFPFNGTNDVAFICSKF